MPRTIALALILGSAATAPQAQSVELSGRVGIGVTNTARADWIAPVDATLSFPLGSRTALELGTFAYALPGKRPHETYIALRWSDFHAGIVRPAYDAVLPSIFEEVAPYRAYAEAETTRAHTTTRAMRVNAVPVGLSYGRQDGDLWWGVSAHDDAKGQFSSATAAIRWQQGPWTVAAAAELVGTVGSTRTNAKLGLRWTGSSIALGLAAFHPDASAQPDTVAADLHWQATDRLGLSLLGETTRGTAADTLGVAASWALSPTYTLNAAALNEGAANSAHVTLTYGF